MVGHLLKILKGVAPGSLLKIAFLSRAMPLDRAMPPDRAHHYSWRVVVEHATAGERWLFTAYALYPKSRAP